MDNEMYYQYGGGVKYVFVGGRNQKGRGIGSFLGGLFRRAIPLVARGMKAVGKESLNTGLNVLNDTLLKGQPVTYSLQNRVNEAGNNLSRKLGNKVGEMMRGGGGVGGGKIHRRRRRRRPKKSSVVKKQKGRKGSKKNHSSSSRGKSKNSSPAKKLKRKIVKKRKSTKSLKSKRKSNKLVKKRLSGRGHCEIDIFN